MESTLAAKRQVLDRKIEGGGVPQETSAAPPIDDIGVGVDLCGNVGAPRLQCGSIG